MGDEWVGIDLGASRFDVVRLTAGTDTVRVARATTFAADDFGALVDLVRGASAIAIDAPAELSTAPHRDDASVNRKFRRARCGEIALGQQAGIWVPWVTPPEPELVPAWMQVGFTLWRSLRAAGCEPVEVYPAGAFRVLAGGPLPRKTTRAGLHARIGVLATHVELPAMVEMWTHDGLDALAAALTAHRADTGAGRRCAHAAPGCDGSSVWLPDGG
jgi:predicted nuclease with RNAse H fold